MTGLTHNGTVTGDSELTPAALPAHSRPDVGRRMADGRRCSSLPPRARLSGRGRAGGHRDVGAPHLAVVQPPQVHQAGARLPVQVAGKLHVAEPGDGKDALQLQPPLDPCAQRAGAVSELDDLNSRIP